MSLSEEDLKSIVSDAAASLKERLVNDLASRINYEVMNNASAAVREHVQEWVKVNVLPDVTAILVESKLSLVNSAAKFAESMTDELAKSMAESLREKMKNSWDRKKIFESMFT